MTLPAAYQPKLNALSPRMERLFRERHWIDGRTVQRLERPDPAHVAQLYRIAGLEPAPDSVRDERV